MTNNNPQLDPTNKLRTSAPQALIDTDFEYGTQVSKWENLSTTNLRPYAYASATTIAGITDIQMTAGSRTVTVSLSNTSALSNGLPIVVNDALKPIANGVFAIDAGSIISNTSFTYTARAAATVTGSIFDTYKTAITIGNYYTNAAIGVAPTWTYSGAKIKAVTTVPHGLSIGNEIQVSGTTAGSGAPNGTWIVSQVESPTAFYFYSTVTPTGTINGGLVYTRPQGSVLHRPFDGGVIFSSNGMSNYESTTRQTRRYFRYQSGKGIQLSSGTILKPNFQLDGLQYIQSSGLVTVTTKDQHNIQPGSTILISGANEGFFNGTITVYSVTGYNTFTYQPATNPGTDTKASGSYYASIIGWYGAVNRLGIFDQQNGLFFEFDGQQLYAVRRNSVYQISGRVAVTSGSNTVTQASGFTTSFSEQLVPGDYVVIRGQSYRVDAIASDTSLTISPSYRGADNVVAAVMSKTVDYRVPQSQWNLDTMDGTGPSGFKIDLSRMQMFYIDFSWYGAGFVRWGLRGTDGDVTYVHKMQNNNVNFEAYMRSGNLPGRYESLTLPPKTILGASLGTTDVAITVGDTSTFPSSGTIVIKGPSAYEHITYTGKTSNSFTGLIRAQAGTTVASGLTASLNTNVIVNTAAFTGVQVGQRVISNTANAFYPDGTFVASISADAKTITLTQSLTGTAAATSVTFIPMGATAAQPFSYSVTAPIAVELAFPTFAPTISHWGTSVIMDGRFDDDKSLLFTYGQTASTSLAPSTSTSVSSVTANVAANTNITIAANQSIVVGMAVTAVGGTITSFPAGTTVTSVSGGGTIIQLSNAVNITGSNLTFTYGTTVSGVTANVSSLTNITVSTTANIVVGMGVTASGGTVTSFPAGTIVYAVVNSTTIQLTNAVNVSNTTLTFTGGSTKALFSIRIAPSVDNGKAAAFGQRDLVNRMQLILRALDIALQGSTSGNLLVTAVLNGTPSTSTLWGPITSTATSSLAQIADYASTFNTTVFGGEVTGGFFVNSTNSVDLSLVRDLGNSVLAGGTTTTNNGIYPDGPDVLTIQVTNLSSTAAASVVGRLSWTEAQA
jgi:hypothetical protein